MNESFREKLSAIFMTEESGEGDNIISSKDMEDYINSGKAEYPVEDAQHIVKLGDLIYKKVDNPVFLNGQRSEDGEDDSYYWEIVKKVRTDASSGGGTGS